MQFGTLSGFKSETVSGIRSAMLSDFVGISVALANDPAVASAVAEKLRGTVGLYVAGRRQRRKPLIHVAVARGNKRRARIRCRAEHVFGAQKCRVAPVIRSIGEASATAKLALASLSCNITRLLWLDTRQAA